MTTIADGQLEIAETLVIGDLTDYRLPADFLQWWTAPQVRTSDYERSASDGLLAGRDLLGVHTTTILTTILADTEAELGDHIDEWKYACRSTPDSVVMVRANLLGRTRLRYGRFRIPGEVQVTTWSLDHVDEARSGDCGRLYAVGSAQFETLDPRTYSDVAHQAVLTREQPGTGFTPPFVAPFTLGAGSSGAAALVNAGNAPAPWTARLDGPLTNPTLVHLDYNRRLKFTANGGLDLQAGQWLDLASDGHAALFDSTGDRAYTLTIDSRWWELGAGSNNIKLQADSGGGTVTVTWRDAWLS